MSKNILIIIFTAVIALAAGVLSHLPKPPEISENTLFASQLPDLMGKQHRLQEWQGKILIINFWATWCPPCLEEIPAFIALQSQYASKNVQFIGIAVDDKHAVADYNATAKINYPILIAGDAGLELSKNYGNSISSIPFTIIVNQQGKVIHKQLGEISREELLTVIQPLLKTP